MWLCLSAWNPVQNSRKSDPVPGRSGRWRGLLVAHSPALGPPSTGNPRLGVVMGPGDSSGSSVGGGGPCRLVRRAHAPLPLYYLAHPQRKSLQIPSFLPAAGGPPPGSGAREWSPSLPPLPPLGTGLEGSGATVEHWGLCGCLKPFVGGTQPGLWGLEPPPPQPDRLWSWAARTTGGQH